MRTKLHTSLLAILLAATVSAQVTLKKKAVVYVGSAANTTAPATLNASKVRLSTPEWKKIKSSGIDPDSARGKQLINKMNQRIRRAVKEVADAEGRDMVTRKKDMKDDRGRDVMDLTDLVISEIEA
ncbi:MAG: hypothetical protein ACON4Z_14305 [Planctomycetota bacterium]